MHLWLCWWLGKKIPVYTDATHGHTNTKDINNKNCWFYKKDKKPPESDANSSCGITTIPHLKREQHDRDGSGTCCLKAGNKIVFNIAYCCLFYSICNCVIVIMFKRELWFQMLGKISCLNLRIISFVAVWPWFPDVWLFPGHTTLHSCFGLVLYSPCEAHKR